MMSETQPKNSHMKGKYSTADIYPDPLQFHFNDGCNEQAHKINENVRIISY